MDPIDKVIARKTAIDKAKKEIKRRRNISKKTRGKTRKRKGKNKGKKRKKKKITTTQVAQPPIRLSNKGGDKLEVNIVAKERRKKRKPKSYAEKRAEEIEKTGVLDPAVLKAQQRISSEVLGYGVQTKDPLTLRARRGRYNVEGGVSGFGNIPSRYDIGDYQLGLRAGLQSDAVRRKKDEFITIEEAREMVVNDRKDRRIPNVRRGTKGTQTRKDDYDDDDDDDDPRGGGKNKRTPPKPQPQPEPEPQASQRRNIRIIEPSPPAYRTSRREIATSPIYRTSRREIATSPIYIPPPLPRRTPPESYFAGVPKPDAPLRFRPLSQPVPPQSPTESVDEEIVEITGGQPASPIITGIQPVGTPQQPQYQDAPSTPSGIAFDDEGFFTPTATGLVLPPEEPITTSQPPSRIVAPSSRPAEAGELERPGSSLASPPEDTPKEGGFKSISSRMVEPAPEPEPIHSVRRGRGRPKGSKNKPRTDTPFVVEETGQGIDRSELKFEALRIQNLLKKRLGSWTAKEVDNIQSLQELNQAIDSFTNDEETAELIRLYWQNRLQLGLLKKL